MADFVLNLGGVDFQDFEIPESIRAGGSQAIDVKKYGDGTRTIDAFGPDDDPITWSGTFLDQDAEPRAQQIDTIRRQGQQVLLSWSSYRYLVVVKAFTFESQRFYQVPYSITLEVVQDLTQPASSQPDDLESLLQGDISDALGLSDLLDTISDGATELKEAIAPLTSAIGEIQSAVTQVNSITGGTVPFLNDLAGKINTAQGISDGLLSALDGDLSGLGSAANFAAGILPDQLVSNINMMVVGAQALPVVFQTSRTLGRLAKNVAGIME